VFVLGLFRGQHSRLGFRTCKQIVSCDTQFSLKCPCFEIEVQLLFAVQITRKTEDGGRGDSIPTEHNVDATFMFKFKLIEAFTVLGMTYVIGAFKLHMHRKRGRFRNRARHTVAVHAILFVHYKPPINHRQDVQERVC